MDEACGFRSRAVHVDEVAGDGIEDPFSYMAATGIPGAEDKDTGFHDIMKRVTAGSVRWRIGHWTRLRFGVQPVYVLEL